MSRSSSIEFRMHRVGMSDLAFIKQLNIVEDYDEDVDAKELAEWLEQKKLLSEIFKTSETLLTKKQLFYIKMYYIQGCTMREIAKILEVNVSSVHRGIWAGICRLRKEFVK